jgi:hypothetical protein
VLNRQDKLNNSSETSTGGSRTMLPAGLIKQRPRGPDAFVINSTIVATLAGYALRRGRSCR